MQRAKRLLEGLRIHHLGFGFFWTVTFIVLAGFQGAGAVADYWQIYILTEQTLMPLAVGALGALCAFRRCELPHWTASAASFMLSGAALLYFLAFHFGQGDGVIAAAAGILMGGSCALFFLLWEMFYVTEGQQRALICIPLSAAMSVAFYLLIRLLPPVAVALAAVCVLPFLALLCLQKSLAEIEADATAPLTRPAYLLIRLLPPVAVALAAVCVLPFLALLCLQKSLAEIEADATAPLTRPALRRAVGDLWRPVALAAVCVLPFLALLCLQKSLAEIEADATAPLTRPALRRAVGDLWRPVLCVSILGFSWKLIAGIEPAQSSGGAAVLVGFATAALLVVALELFLSKGFDIILGFSWKLIAGIEPAQSSGGAAVLVGFATAALLVVALELFLSKGFDILHICQVLFPALTVVFLLPSLFGQQYTTLLVAFLMFGFEVVNLLLIITICQVLFPALTVVFLLPSLFGQQYTTLLVAFLMFGFEVVNLLLIITCAVYTIRNGLPSSPLYALCIGPVLLSMAVGSGLAELLGPALSDDLAHWTNVILLCVVLLSVALILVTRGAGRASGAGAFR